MPLYWTGLIPNTWDEATDERCQGRGWKVVLAPAPECHIAERNIWREQGDGPAAQSVQKPARRSRERHVHGPGIYLEAASDLAAQHALELIWIALAVVNTGAASLDHLPHPRRVDPTTLRIEEGPDEQSSWGTYSTSGLHLACCVAARASRRRDSVYALVSLGFSQSIAALHYVDLEPGRAEYISLSRLPLDHVRFAYAIISAYAVIEQLGLEVRASAQRPTFVNSEWNPSVRQDLEDRLRRAHVDVAETVLWHVRGPSRRVERRRRPRAISRALWAWREVRDVEVAVIDAIADASWLRSKVAAHRLGALARGLSVYDVANCQCLARHLLFSSLRVSRVLRPTGRDS